MSARSAAAGPRFFSLPARPLSCAYFCCLLLLAVSSQALAMRGSKSVRGLCPGSRGPLVFADDVGGVRSWEATHAEPARAVILFCPSYPIIAWDALMPIGR